MTRKTIAGLILVFAIVGLIWIFGDHHGWNWLHGPGHHRQAGSASSPFVDPELSADAADGKVLFQANCQACHGSDARGSDQGPPLVHRIYEPGHHGDPAFQIAVRNGVRAHHWNFGDMPAIDGLSVGDVSMIIAYIREIQRANGIQ